MSACNGNASYIDTDLALSGTRPPFAFVRSYNAQDNRTAVTDTLGKTWTIAYDANYRATSSSDPLGNTTTFGGTTSPAT